MNKIINSLFLKILNIFGIIFIFYFLISVTSKVVSLVKITSYDTSAFKAFLQIDFFALIASFSIFMMMHWLLFFVIGFVNSLFKKKLPIQIVKFILDASVVSSFLLSASLILNVGQFASLVSALSLAMIALGLRPTKFIGPFDWLSNIQTNREKESQE